MKLLVLFFVTIFSIHSFAQTLSSKDSAIVKQFLPSNSVVGKAFKVDLEGDGIMKHFLPPNSLIDKKNKLDLEREDIYEIAFSYKITGPLDKEHLLIVNASDVFNSGLKILKFSDSLGWTIAFEEKEFSGNGIGIWGAPVIEIIHNTTIRKKAVLVVVEVSGAGSATGWDLISSINGKIVKLSPSIRKKVLADRHCQDDIGYNKVITDGTYITETQHCSPIGACRICWDKTYEMRFVFAGNSIELDSVREIDNK